MKKAVHLFLLPLLAFICCFAIDKAESSALQNFVLKQVAAPESSTQFAGTEQLVGIPQQVESYVRNLQNTPPPASKNSFKGSLPGTKVLEFRLQCLFTQYHFISENILARFRKTDLIFLFHYFW